MPVSGSAATRHDTTTLGRFLRSRREAIRPEAVGLPEGGRRRTPGLRRDEVAELADISVDWYIRLEQGRPVTPSRQTVDALASALCLDAVETAHLYALTGTAPAAGAMDETAPPAVRRLVDRLSQPAYITNRLGDVLHWNGQAERLFGFGGVSGEDRNVYAGMFLRESSRRLFAGGWAAEAKRMLAEFRPVYDVNATDPRFVRLVGRLQAGSAEFAKWWSLHDIRKGGGGQKTLYPPKGRKTRYEYVALQVTENPALKTVIYSEI
ncbi:MAG: helix-turn-helix transcriptional regulator [Hyphomonas sp.]|uniref:helix-turn-helix transcriptional regulator n=1 Tax=Hyphomonas sp. TaxID=87 RepID=UPI003528C496